MRTKQIRLWIIAILSVIVVSGAWSGVYVPQAAAAGTTYYVDSVAGNDASAGTSAATAWKNLSKVNEKIFNPGDKILLKAGSIWSNQYLDLKGSGTNGNPIIVDKYGEGSKPLIHFGNTAVEGEGFGVRLKNVSYWEINNLEITSGQHATDMRRNGILVVGEGAGAGDFNHIYIRNNDIHDIFGTDRRTGGINFHARGSDTSPESTWNDILIEGNTVINVADTGIQVMTDAFFNPSWNHIFDAFRNVVIRGNYVERIHRDGILVRSGVSPLIEYNTTNNIGRGSQFNAAVVKYLDAVNVVAAQWSYYTTGAVFQYNEAFDTKRFTADGQPWDFDRHVRNSIYQYNYSHNNEGGTLLVMDDTSGNIFRYNISQNDLDLDSGGMFTIKYKTGHLYVYNNIFYRSLSQNKPLTATTTAGNIYYTNNVFYNAAAGTYINGGRVIYRNNNFYGANATVPNDPNKIIGDPLFVNGGGATGRSTANAYQLLASSPLINAGAVVAGNGGQDFFGNPLYNDAPDIGIHEYYAATTLFEDDFEDGNSNGWTTSGGSWSVVSDGSLVFAQTSASSGERLAHAGDTSWTNYSLEADVKLNTAGGNAGVLFRYADANNYYMFRLNDGNNKVELYKKTAGTLTLVASSPYEVEVGQWHNLKVSVNGGAITASVDHAEVMNWVGGSAELSSGKIGVRMHTSRASFDNVKVMQ